VLESWPAEFASLPFGSPEFKAANARLAAEDEAVCAPFARAMPTWINLTSTTVCNLQCFMCNQFLDPNSPKEIMAEDVYEKVVRELYPYARTMQLSAFGEPLMTPRMEQKLDDLERYGMKLEMVTNATLMMKESRFREKLLRCLELVTFSMDGATRDTYNSVVANITRFAEKRLELAPAARPRMNFNYILMKRTVREAPRFVEMVHRWGGDQIVFNHLVTFHPSLVGESLNYMRAEANEWQDRTREVAKALGVQISMPPNFADVAEPAAVPATAGATPATGAVRSTADQVLVPVAARLLHAVRRRGPVLPRRHAALRPHARQVVLGRLERPDLPGLPQARVHRPPARQVSELLPDLAQRGAGRRRGLRVRGPRGGMSGSVFVAAVVLGGGEGSGERIGPRARHDFVR
jgi:pyruvate-formate lyase-activating enzyme